MPESHRTSTFIMMKKVLFMLAMLTCIFASCSDGGSEDINPTPKPDDVKYEITIDASIISNGLSFDTKAGEGSISFTANANWTLTVASTTSGATWCKASATSGTKGSATVKFTVEENTGYEDRSVSVTIKAGTASKTFTIIQKGVDALLVTTNKYEVVQEGGTIEVEVKANIDYSMEISETAKGWISEASSRALKTYKHTFNITSNDETENREGEITFKSGDKVETVKVYQAGGAIIMLTQDEYIVSDAGEMITVDIKSNIEFGVQMPNVDWIVDEASSRGMSSHTLNYYIEPNEGYDSRSAEIIFFDKNSDLKDTLKVVQTQKDAIIISKKEYDVKAEGETIEVKLSANVDIEVQIPSNAAWVAQTESRALTEKSIILKVAENTNEENRSAEIIFKDKNSDLSEKVTITQKCPTPAGYVDGVLSIKTAGTMKKLLGDDYMNITSLKIVGPINGDDIYYLRKMSGGYDFSEIDRGKLNTLDLSEASIVKGGDWYHKAGIGSSYTGTDTHYTSDNIIGQSMFRRCYNLQKIILPQNIISIEAFAFEGCVLTSITIPEGVTSIGYAAFEDCELLTAISIPSSVTSVSHQAFDGCGSLVDVYIKDVAAWCSIDFDTHSWNNPLHYGANMYLNNELVTELVIPEGVKAINNLAFYRLESITKIVMPNTLKSIGEEAFYGCKNLKSLEIPNNVTSIGELAFCACDSLESLTIGDGIELIPRSAFSGFDLLSKLVIGKGVKKIDVQAFSGTITQCYSYATTPPTLLTEKAYNPYYGDFYIDAFYYSSFKDAILYVPARCGSAYKTSRWGKYFTNIVEMD